MTLSATHRPGVDNVLANYLSRTRMDPTEWSLNTVQCRQLLKLWGKPQVDLFACKQNHQLETCFSRCAQPETVATDTFSQQWTGLSIYAFPPHSENSDQDSPGQGGGCVRGGSKLAQEALAQPPTRDSNGDTSEKTLTLLSQKVPRRGTLYHHDLQKLDLTAWKLNAAPGKKQVSPRWSLIRPLLPTDPLPGQCMKPIGPPSPCSLTGVQNMGTIKFLCL